jgi:hypothetical protein
MNRHLFTVAFFLGALGIIWSGTSFIDSSLLALSVTALIGVVYLYGTHELRQFRRATSTLTAALAAIPERLENLGDWLNKVHPSLQDSVRLRIEGERAGLPGPSLTPYLVGLLVMLGMLGTFLGMIVTLKGAVFALEKTTDLEAIRSALALPVKGLGMAFGTSVAGVAASAMLGLMSALSRRERIEAAQLLDGKIATVLRQFSLTYQRQETFKALQQQSRALPEVADKLQSMMAQMEGMSRELSLRLTSNQDAFHDNIKAVYTDLAGAVDKSLRASLSQGAHAAADSIRPVVEASMNSMVREAEMMHERTAATLQMQLDGMSARMRDSANAVAETWTAALKSHEQANTSIVSDIRVSLDAFSETFEQRSGALVEKVGTTYASLQADQVRQDKERQEAWTKSLENMAALLSQELQQTGAQTLAQQQQICATLTRTAQDITEQAQSGASATLGETKRLITSAEELMRSRIASESQWMEQHRERMDQLAHLFRSELGILREQEEARGHAAVERLGQLQVTVKEHLITLGTSLEEPITRLIHTASEAPRAAAEVIGHLRQEISHSVARDNELLEERSRIMETLNTLLEAINHASQEQRSIIDSLVTSSTTALNMTAVAFSDSVTAEAGKLSDIAAQVTSSAVEVSSLSETFGFAVNAFNEANEKLIANLERIEGAMDKTLSRSDEQLAYYVAQAREIIDLSMMSQKEIIEGLRRIPAKHVVIGGEEVNNG